MRTFAATSVALLLLGGACRTPRTSSAPPAPPAATVTDEPATRATPPQPASRLLHGSVPLLSPDMTEADLSEVVTPPALILYFSTTCPHCWNVAGEFQQACERLAGQGVQCVGVVSSSSRLGAIREFADLTGVEAPLYLDYAASFRDSYEMTATPTGLYFDEAGQAVAEAKPFYQGASLLLEMAIAENQGREPASVWQPGHYYGARACSPCHETAYNSWLLSSHALTVVRLPGESHLDPACMQCHATGAGEPGGFVGLSSTSHLRDVGCEACHGPAGGHGPDGVEAIDPAGRCRTCHDPDHTLAFDPQVMAADLDHRRAEKVPRDRWELHRLRLAEGRHERYGLAVAEGKCVGSTTCEECHAEQFESWSRSPHAHGVETLASEGSQRDRTCLACHAPSDPCSPAHKRGGGGIGCEACHGPGADHADDENVPVTGIRASHEKRCVVEPTCRGCHTPERDPEWDFEVRLAGVHGVRGE